MKNFDLEAAKRGAAVCTRGGCKARIVCSNVDSPLFSIVAMVRDSASGKETPQSYRDDGGWLPANRKCSQDLMMCDDDYLEKLERGEYQSGQIRPLYENPSNSMPLNLTKREWFAGMAMAGEISGCLAAGNGFDGDKSIPGIIAKSSVMIADAMIEELEKTDK
ncbi:hypothetical protein [Alistipes senegalensis]|uniref:hypothetical protein n=1 Tax=Alistipes senegalensis TaxID=1288121 RepID=UPI0018A96338|nr:hypothetical protein [Alistipes senegalensis]